MTQTPETLDVVGQTFDLSVVIPAYGRPLELRELLYSIHSQTVLPREIVICEDNSADREKIRAIALEWQDRFDAQGCFLRYYDNVRNLGYDGNVREVIRRATSRWAMLMGNDDVLLYDCIETAQAYICSGHEYPMISRAFVRFDKDAERPIGLSRMANADTSFHVGDDSPRAIVRASGFVSGLILDRSWADSLATESYDGTLYYQLYLAAVAYCAGGIGYIAKPIVAGRSGNAPLFGTAEAEKGVHIPGSYSPGGRAKMWASILRIVDDVGKKYNTDLVSQVKSELEIQKSFHVFEMYVGADSQILAELRRELTQIGLFNHPVPRLLYVINQILGKRARYFYALVRRTLQRKD